MKRFLVMASGRGSNFAAIADAISKNQIPNAEIVGLICNKKKAFAIQEAEQRNIPVILVESRRFLENGTLNRAKYEETCLTEIRKFKPDYILLAGYMLVLSEKFVLEFPNQILNIHPSLLPKYKGMHAIQQALDAKATLSGCTVHFVTPLLDDGPIICQKSLEILVGDTEESYGARLRPLEHAAYIEAVKKLSQSAN